MNTVHRLAALFGAMIGLLAAFSLTSCTFNGDMAPTASPSPSPSPRPSAAVDVEQLYRRECIINLAPRNYDPRVGRFPTPEQLKADLLLLRDAGFTGVTTYTAEGSIGRVPEIAKQQVGFAVVGMGLWDPLSEEEMRTAIDQSEWVDFFILGNEGITDGRYTLADLLPAMERLRAATGKPVTTTETLAAYESNPELCGAGDWVSMNHHPWWAGERDPARAATWTGEQYRIISARLRQHRDDDALVFREVGWPTDGDPQASEANQREFLRLVQEERVPLGFFEAFDMPFKWEPSRQVEAHWGIFRADGSPKPAAEVICGKAAPALPEASATP